MNPGAAACPRSSPTAPRLSAWPQALKEALEATLAKEADLAAAREAAAEQARAHRAAQERSERELRRVHGSSFPLNVSAARPPLLPFVTSFESTSASAAHTYE